MRVNKQKEVRIKYDKQSMRLLKATAIAATILFVVGLVLMFLEISGTEILVLLSLYIGAGLAAFSYLSLLAGWLYMRRLKGYGYEIPERKSDYDGKIENMPKINHVDATSIYSEHSKWCARACILFFGVFFILDVCFFLKWKFMKENCKALFVLCLFFYLIWVIFALALKKQSNREKYRDDVESDTTRKERWSLEQILFTMLILCLLSMFANYTAHSMTRYIFNTMIEHDMVQADIVCRDIVCAIEECSDVTNNKTYGELCEGIDITTWGAPEDELQISLSGAMSIDDFALLRDDFKVSDGDARIFVKVTDGRVTVRLLNPIKEVSKYSRGDKEIYVESDLTMEYH